MSLLVLHGAATIRDYAFFVDDFTDDRAAGALNSTLTSDGKAKRVVNDTNSYLSSSGGKLLFANGTGSEGNPGIWYTTLADGPFTVAAGLAMLVTWTPVVGDHVLAFGFDSNTSAGPASPHIITAAGPGDGLVIIDDTGDLAPIIGSMTVGVSQTHMIVARGPERIGHIFQHVLGNQWKRLYVSEDYKPSTDVYPTCCCAQALGQFHIDRIALLDLSSLASIDFSNRTDWDPPPPAESETIDRAAGSADLRFGSITLPGTDPIKIAIRYVDATNYTLLYINADGSGSIKETIAGVEGSALGSCVASSIVAGDLRVLDDAGSVSVFSEYNLAFTATLTDHAEAVLVELTSLGT